MRSVRADCAKDARSNEPVGEDGMEIACGSSGASVLQVQQVVIKTVQVKRHAAGNASW